MWMPDLLDIREALVASNKGNSPAYNFRRLLLKDRTNFPYLVKQKT